MSLAKIVPRFEDRVSSGIEGLDDVMLGGFPRSHFCLVEGDPGTGKTTRALQFLLEGRKRGEESLYVTLSETRKELCAVAASHGWSLDGIEIYELGDFEDRIKPERQYTVFHPAEVELSETTRKILDQVEKFGPARVVFDSPSELRMLAQGVLTMLPVAQHGLVGGALQVPVEISYLADSVIMLRFFEAAGEVRQAISVVKKRHGMHERTIRGMAFSSKGLRIGDPFKDFHGVLTGLPIYTGAASPLLPHLHAKAID